MPSAPVVILTLEATDNARLAGLLAQQGLESFSYPCIATSYLGFDPAAPVDGRKLSEFGVIAFTSKRGAIGLIPARQAISDARPLVGCVGEATALAVQEHLGLACDIIPPLDRTAAGLADEIIRRCRAPRPLLHVRGNKVAGSLKQILEQSGWQVSELTVYQNHPAEILPLAAVDNHIGIFASPSAAENFFSVNSHCRASLPCIAIGPATGAHLRAMGITEVREPGQPDLAAAAAAAAAFIRERTTDGH